MNDIYHQKRSCEKLLKIFSFLKIPLQKSFCNIGLYTFYIDGSHWHR